MSMPQFTHVIPFLLTGTFIFTNAMPAANSSYIKDTTFKEGILYSKTSFPNHPLNDTIKTLQFESSDFVEQYHVIQALKHHQQGIAARNNQEVKDVFFVSGMMVLPIYTKTYISPKKALVHIDAFGYHQKVLIDNSEGTAKMVIHDRKKDNSGTIWFQTQDLLYVWQKYQVNAEQYTIQNTTETSVVAGYRCKKIVYTFQGTSRGIPVTSYVINLQPEKVTAWVTDELPSSINVQHPLFFESNKAVLKFEVEYDKKGKNKMLVETTKIESTKIDDKLMTLDDVAPVADHTKNKMEGEMIVMQVMMAAIALLVE